MRRRFFIAVAASLVLLVAFAHAQTDPLPSWNDGAAKTRIVDFVKAVTDSAGKDYVIPADRIAVFDNDGTLWAEKPVYFQLLFAIDRARALAQQHPEWKATQPFKAAIEGDFDALVASGEKGIVELVMATHAGMTTEAFAQIVGDWIKTAQHPRFKRPYTDLVYQPMLELLHYLRANDFKIYIVSGGGVEFLRVWADRVYGVPPEQVIGSSIVTRFEMQDGKPILVRENKIDFIDDKAGKPVAINQFIGRRPIFAFGNSDGDHQMLQWTAAGDGARFMGLVHHTDVEREWAYDRNSTVGRLDKALDDAGQNGWTVVDMKRDWKRVFPFQQ